MISVQSKPYAACHTSITWFAGSDHSSMLYCMLYQPRVWHCVRCTTDSARFEQKLNDSPSCLIYLMHAHSHLKACANLFVTLQNILDLPPLQNNMT